MPIKEHPVTGTLLLCDFSVGFKVPEMVKLRPVVVISPKIAARPGLCTVVALSTTKPDPVMSYHCEIHVPALPESWSSEVVWVKGDMVNTVGFHRLDFFRLGKNRAGKRQYLYTPLSSEKYQDNSVLRAQGAGNVNVDKSALASYINDVSGSRESDPRLRPHQGPSQSRRYQAFLRRRSRPATAGRFF